MKKQLFKTLKKSASSSTSYSSSESGFSLVELAVIVVMIGIFSAIAAPVWDVFVSRQRVGAVNGQVLQALQSAQAEAKRNKVSRKIEFDNNTDQMPVYRIYQPDTDGDFDPTGDLIDESVIEIDGQIEPGQIQITTQANNGTAPLQDAIIFNYMGAVESPKPVSSRPQPKKTDGFTVTVSNPDGGLKQCVKVVTILGAMITSEGDDNPTGCP